MFRLARGIVRRWLYTLFRAIEVSGSLFLVVFFSLPQYVQGVTGCLDMQSAFL